MYRITRTNIHYRDGKSVMKHVNKKERTVPNLEKFRSRIQALYHTDVVLFIYEEI